MHNHTSQESPPSKRSVRWGGSIREKYNSLISKAKKIQEQINNLNDFYNIIIEKYNDLKEIDKIVDNYIVRIIKYKDKIVFELFTGDNMEVSMSKYPKRVNSRDYVPIMDIKHRYKIDRGAVQYYEEINIEVLLVA